MAYTPDTPFPWKYTAAAALVIGLLTFGLSGWIGPVYKAEAIIFVPLMVAEKQIAQDGFGFGGPAEIDAHLEILRSSNLAESVEQRLLSDSGEADAAAKAVKSLSSKRTPNGAIAVSAEAENRRLAMLTVRAAIDTADAHKSRMLKANRVSAAVQASARFAEKADDVNTLRNTLDSLRTLSRIADEKARISLQTRSFEYEVRLSHAVEELAKYESQKQRLARAVEAELPATYVLGDVSGQNEPARPSRMLFALMAMAAVVLFSVFYHFATRHS